MMDPRRIPIDTRKATPTQLLVLAETFEPGRRKDAALVLFEGRIAAGLGGQEEQAIRLMAYLAGKLRPGPTHSRVSDPLKILLGTEAWCDQSSKSFMYLAWHLAGIDGRELALTHENGTDGHTVVELEWGGAWHLFDAHRDHQAIYRDPGGGAILSHEGLRACPSVVKAEDHPWPVGREGLDKSGFYTEGARSKPSARTREQIAFNLPWPCPWNCR